MLRLWRQPTSPRFASSLCQNYSLTQIARVGAQTAQGETAPQQQVEKEREESAAPDLNTVARVTLQTLGMQS